nr:hypothetical protein OG999_01990 [Streptomyces sp. NBC_00886]
MNAPVPEPTSAERRRPVEMLEVLARRWPTALGVAVFVAAVAVGGSGDTADAVSGYAEFLPLLPLLYLITHQIGKPRATWPVLVAGLVLVFVLQLQDRVSQPVVLVALSLALLVWGAIRGTPYGRAVFGAQAVGALVFGALALVGLAVDADLGRYLVAAGWFFHGVWDFVHVKLDKVVSRSFAEWCGVVDVLVAVDLLFLV